MKRLSKRIAALLLAALLVMTAASASAEIMLRAGGSFGFAVDAKGVVWGWGDNTKGQLGNGTKKRQYQPAPVALGLDGAQIADIQCGNENTLFLMKDGTVYTCGPNNYGQQGVADAPNYVYTPIQVEGLENIVQIATGFGQCLALTSDGQVYAWGRNNLYQAGTGKKGNVRTPALLPLENIVNIQCGGKFCMAMDAEGNIWGWGDNESGQLLSASRVGRPVSVPTLLNISGRFTAIACGGSTAFGLDAEGVLWAWGKNDYGQMGTNAVRKNSAEPVRVELPDGLQIMQIRAYNAHSAVVTRDGQVYQWGRTYSGQLGNGTRPTRSLPTLACPEGESVVEAATGSSCTYLLLRDGTIRTSGYSEVGQTGAFPTSKGYISTWQNPGLNLLDGTWNP